MLVVSIAGLVVGVIALLGVYFTYQQVRMLKEDRRQQRDREQETIQWAGRAAEVVHRLCVLMPRWHGTGSIPNTPQGALYTILFPNPNDRQKIESHLIRLNGQRNAAEARDITPEMLQMPNMQEAIRLVEECFDRTKRGESATCSSSTTLSSVPVLCPNGVQLRAKRYNSAAAKRLIS